MVNVLLFSNDLALQPLLSSALGDDFQVTLTPDLETLRGIVSANQGDVMILDLCSKQGSTSRLIECYEGIVAMSVPAIIMADDHLRPAAIELVQNGAFGYCRRPPSIRDLKVMLYRAHQSKAPQQNPVPVPPRKEEPSSCDKLIGSSPGMRRLYHLVRSVTNVSAAVLVTGESGTGKELIARAIHNLGQREGKPFVAVSCGAIPETLVESELFGHERGAFTGSVGARAGYFEQAGDGTLFLDEIGDLSLFTQVKLLRVLQQMEFSRLGSSRLIPLRARIVFATHRDLAKLVAEGKFRQDLFYRITVMRIESPSLRQRPEDIPVLAHHFLRQYSLAFQKPMNGIDSRAVQALQDHAWPGNVRELENVIQRAIIVAQGNTVAAEDLSLTFEEEEVEESESGLSRVLQMSDYLPNGSFERKLNEYKLKVAGAAIRENNGNKTHAARSLGISRAYLHRLIRASANYSESVQEKYFQSGR